MFRFIDEWCFQPSSFLLQGSGVTTEEGTERPHDLGVVENCCKCDFQTYQGHPPQELSVAVTAFPRPTEDCTR